MVQCLALNFVLRIMLSIVGRRLGEVTLVLCGVAEWNYSSAGLLS